MTAVLPGGHRYDLLAPGAKQVACDSTEVCGAPDCARQLGEHDGQPVHVDGTPVGDDVCADALWRSRLSVQQVVRAKPCGCGVLAGEPCDCASFFAVLRSAKTIVMGTAQYGRRGGAR